MRFYLASEGVVGDTRYAPIVRKFKEFKESFA
jgi:hypothetical protein